jgi:hydroxymethylpyrimidine pyrophosphatase-like HAD family hydrolase
MGIIDSDNDINMIKNVDYGCTVKVTKESLKKISDYICENDYAQDAVKEVIDNF